MKYANSIEETPHYDSPEHFLKCFPDTIIESKSEDICFFRNTKIAPYGWGLRLIKHSKGGFWYAKIIPVIMS